MIILYTIFQKKKEKKKRKKKEKKRIHIQKDRVINYITKSYESVIFFCLQKFVVIQTDICAYIRPEILQGPLYRTN